MMEMSVEQILGEVLTIPLLRAWLIRQPEHACCRGTDTLNWIGRYLAEVVPGSCDAGGVFLIFDITGLGGWLESFWDWLAERSIEAVCVTAAEAVVALDVAAATQRAAATAHCRRG